jgi:hypothetical protein
MARLAPGPGTHMVDILRTRPPLGGNTIPPEDSSSSPYTHRLGIYARGHHRYILEETEPALSNAGGSYRGLAPIHARPFKRGRRSTLFMKQEMRLVGDGGGRFPPYNSMRRGFNVHFVDFQHNIEFRRLMREEVEATTGADAWSIESGAHRFCFHVRVTPSKFRSNIPDVDNPDHGGEIVPPHPMELDGDDDPGGGKLDLHTGQSLHLFPMAHSDGIDAYEMVPDPMMRTAIAPNLQAGPGEAARIMFHFTVDSFQRAPTGSHGILWCTG